MSFFNEETAMDSVELAIGSFSDHTQDGVLVYQEERLLYATPRAAEILGWTPEDLRNTVFSDIFPPHQDPNDTFRDDLTGVPRIGRYEANVTRKDNSICAVEITAAKGKSKGVPVITVIIRDVTEHRRREKALHEIESHFLQLTNNIDEVFFVRDLENNRITYVSPAYEKIWRRPVSSMYENPLDFMENVHPEDKSRIQEIIERRNQSRQGFSAYQYRIIWPDGQVRSVRVRTFPVLNRSGRPYRVAGIAEDITAIKAAEDQLRLNERQLRQIIDLVPHAIFVKDHEGRYLLVNKTAAEYYGMTVEDLTGTLQRDVHGREDQTDRMLADDKAVMEANRPKLIPEEEFVDSAGRHHILQTIKIPFTASKDGQSAVLGVATDITDRKRAEAALILSEERFRRSLQHANIGVWDWNIRSGALHWSERVTPLFGRTPGAMETSYNAFLSAIHPDDRLLVERAVQSSIESGEDYEVEHRVVWPDGSIHWLHEAGGVVYDTGGEPERMLGTVQDVTPRKVTEQALFKSEHKYRAVMENASDAILLGTMDAWIIDANRRAEELLGYSREELLKMHGTAIHPKEDHATLSAAFHDLAEKGRSLYQHLVLRKDGTVANVEVAASVVELQDEKFVMAIFRDITARKRAEEERLAHAETQRETLVREVHHRIKNNLQGVVGLLRQHATRNPELREPLEAAINQVNSMAVVHGLYGRSRTERIVLCEMVEAICQSTVGLTGRAIEPRLTVNVESPIRVSNEEAVPLGLILNELVFNAVKHQADFTQPIQVHVQDATDGARVRIVTPATQLPQDFDLASDRGVGTGLKLVKSLLPPSGCRLRIGSETTNVVAELELRPPVVEPSRK